MARWSEERQLQARTAILDAARDAFERDGFDGATMRAIAQSSGVAVGTLFNYFPDKLALLREALHSDMEALTVRLVTDVGIDSPDLVSLFVDFATPSFEHFCARPSLSKVLLRESLFADGPRAADYGEQATRIAAAMTRRIIELQSRGGLDAAARPDAVTLAFFSHYYFILMTQLGASDVDILLRQIALLGEQLQRGVGPR